MHHAICLNCGEWLHGRQEKWCSSACAMQANRRTHKGEQRGRCLDCGGIVGDSRSLRCLECHLTRVRLNRKPNSTTPTRYIRYRDIRDALLRSASESGVGRR